jgi:hypothetical protein
MLDYYLVLFILTRKTYACNAVGTLSETNTGNSQIRQHNKLCDRLPQKQNSLPIQVYCAWFQASATMWMKFALFWDITKRRMIIPYRRFGTSYRSLLGSRNTRRMDFLTIEDEADRSSRNVGKELPFSAALNPTRVRISKLTSFLLSTFCAMHQISVD